MKKILIIEDNEDVRENTAAILEFSNYEVITAENGKIGIQLAKKVLPDLILCDIMMPIIDGYAVLKALNDNNETATIPFIFLTALTEKDEMRKGMNLGADDYLTKPFSEIELIGALESRLKKHDFLQKEFSKTAEEIGNFIEEAATFLNIDYLNTEYSKVVFKKKKLVYEEGNSTNALYFIESGVVKTFKTTEKGKELVTGLHTSGSFIGQLSLLSEAGNYVDSAMVIEEAKLFKISKLDFQTIIKGNRDVAMKFIKLISNDLIEMQNHFVDIAFSTVRKRVAKTLLEISKTRILTHGEAEGIAISREDFAGLLGTATETAIRMLTQFKDEGIITFDASRKIYIKEKKVLEDIVLFG
ncbi:response regulator [Flavobacterium sp. PL12]|uniref:response regulator n=1 Tax=Flavobacterium sp. PL12 TaxID=3071718 RepID=UPI00319EBC6A